MREPLVVPKRSAPLVRWVLVHTASLEACVRRCGAPYQGKLLAWPRLLRAIESAPPSAVVLVDPCAGGRLGLDERLPELMAATRGIVPVVAALPFDSTHGPMMPQLAEMGIAGFVDTFTGMAGPQLRARLHTAHAQPFKRKVEPGLSPFISPRALTILRATMEVAVDRGKMIDVAAILSVDSRTVAAWCTREALPPIKRLLAWQRILLALWLMEDGQRNVRNAALCSGYIDASMRRALQTFLGGDVLPRQRRFADGIAAFNGELRQMRESERRGPFIG